MNNQNTLSLPAAILININIMLGAGIFINTAVVAQRAGVLGAMCYALVGVLMLPLILSIAHLLTMHPTGGFYAFGKKEINSFAGFISAWSYFVGKLASAMLMIHISVLLLQQLIPAIAAYNPLIIDGGILGLFIALNMFNMQTGSAIQVVFMMFKIIPIIFAVLAGLVLFNGAHIGTQHRLWAGIPSTLPLVLYAIIGFEAACSLSSKIRDAHKNASRAVLISFAIVIAITCLYQFLFYAALGTTLAGHVDYRQVFPALIANVLPHTTTAANMLATILHLAIASSALGGSYGIIYSNTWNLYTLAQYKHTLLPNVLTRLNRNNIPWVCVLIEGAVCLMYLFTSRGNQIPLQLTSVLGVAFQFVFDGTIRQTKNLKATRIGNEWHVAVHKLV